MTGTKEMDSCFQRNGILDYKVKETGVFGLNGGSRPVEASKVPEEKTGVPLWMGRAITNFTSKHPETPQRALMQAAARKRLSVDYLTPIVSTPNPNPEFERTKR
ncbi:MAG: hypothetical protein HQK89_14260 [Nitrospirae bacterium]|nr:hypothetical protein [Nitrospirota bacterium]